MKKISLALAVLLGAFCVLAATPSLAQQSTTSMDANTAFKGVYGGPSADDKQVALNIATAELLAAHGGYGPSVTNTTIGTVVETNNYNGPVSNSGATNSINSSSNTSTITANDGSTVTLTPSTNQYSGNAGQTATAIDDTNSHNTSATTNTGN